MAYSLNFQEIFVYDLIRNFPEKVVDGANPAWSPDGRHIAFIRGGSESNPWEGASLYVLSLETGVESKLVDGTLFSELSDPTWGPQSDYVVFSWVDFFTDSGIYYVPRWGGDAEILRWWAEHHLHHPDIAPYGGEMLVEGHPDDYTRQDVYKITLKTNRLQRLTSTSDSRYNYDPDWWHPASFSVQPQALSLMRTWGELKKRW